MYIWSKESSDFHVEVTEQNKVEFGDVNQNFVNNVLLTQSSMSKYMDDWVQCFLHNT